MFRPSVPTARNISLPSTQRKAGYVSRYPLQVLGKEIAVETPLVGRHQLRNIALAIAAAEELKPAGIRDHHRRHHRARHSRNPLAGTFPGSRPRRTELPEYVFDVAHNPAGAWALRSTLSATYEDRPLIFVFGAMRDKAIGEMAEILFPLADRVIATHADNPRSATPAEIREAAAQRVSVEIEDAPMWPRRWIKARRAAGTQGVGRRYRFDLHCGRGHARSA